MLVFDCKPSGRKRAEDFVETSRRLAQVIYLTTTFVIDKYVVRQIATKRDFSVIEQYCY